MTDGFQDYFRPIDAAKALGIDPERIRDRVLWFDHEPERFPLYYKLTRSYHAHWMLDPELEHPEHSGPTKGETELGAGRCFEIHPSDAHEVAARPDEPHKVRALRSPTYRIGTIPACSLIVLHRDFISLSYADCWIGQEDIERIRPGITQRVEAPHSENPPDLVGENKAEQATDSEGIAEINSDRALAMMAWMLSEKAPAYKVFGKPNAVAIAKAVEYLAQNKFGADVRGFASFNKRIGRALKSLDVQKGP